MSEQDREHTDMPSPFERSLLLSARADAPPSEATEQAWLRFSGVMAAAAASAGSLHAGAIAATSGWARLVRLSALKYLAIGALGGSALTFAWLRTHPIQGREAAAAVRSANAESASAAYAPAPPLARVAKSQPEPTAVIPGHGAAAIERKHEKPPSAATAQTLAHSAPFASAAPTSLSAETAALDAARNASATGAFQRALSLLARYQQDFPNGVLRDDAEVATIQTLDAAGEHTQAARRAMQFLAAYPNDPHSATLKRLLSR